MQLRKIIHIDMDAFYASIEQRDNPEYRGKPIAVGGSRKRGVVAAASYEARAFGVRSAMPSVSALRKCPGLIFVPPRFSVYRAVSNDIRKVFLDYTSLVEPLSLDEAYLDVTANHRGIDSAIKIAREIKTHIKKDTGLTASAGISINKFLAKIASDLHKPDGCTFIPPDRIPLFIESLPIEKFYGIGKVTAQKMKGLGIFSGKDLKKWPEVELVKHFGKVGRYYFQIARGQDDRSVEPSRPRKSYSAERTYETDLEGSESVLDMLRQIAHIVATGLRSKEISGKTIQLKVRYSDFHTITRQKTIPEFTNDESTIFTTCSKLIEEGNLAERPIRLLGVGLSNLNTDILTNESQLSLNI